METNHLPPTPNFDRIQPRLCVNARLRRLHRLLNSAYQAKITPFGLRGSMLSILFIIGKNPGVNQKTIANLLVLDPSTMSRDLKKLVSKGWVEITSGQDSRNSALLLTVEGCELLEEVSPIWEALHEQVTQLLGSFQLQQIDLITQAIQKQVTE